MTSEGPRRRRLWWGLAALLVFLAAAALATWYARFRDAPREVPTVELSDMAPALAEAMATARASVVSQPSNGAAWGFFGSVLLAHYFDAEALRTCFAHADRLDPDDGRWAYLEARAWLSTDPTRAVACLEKAVARQPVDPTSRLLLAELLQEQGRSADAERYFSEAAAADPSDARALLGLARLALRGGDMPLALCHAEASHRNAPLAQAPVALLAEIHLRLGHAKEAAQLQARAATLSGAAWPDPHMEAVARLSLEVVRQLDLANDHIAQGRTEEGIGLLERAVRDNPTSVPARISLGRAWLRLERWQAACDALQEAVALRPTDALALADLGYAFRKLGNFDRAIACYRQASRLNPHDAEIYYNLGFCHHERGDASAAIQDLRKAVQLRPQFAVAWRSLGQALAATDPAEALVCYRRAVELAPNDELARKLMQESQSRNLPGNGPPQR